MLCSNLNGGTSRPFRLYPDQTWWVGRAQHPTRSIAHPQAATGNSHPCYRASCDRPNLSRFSNNLLHACLDASSTFLMPCSAMIFRPQPSLQASYSQTRIPTSRNETAVVPSPASTPPNSKCPCIVMCGFHSHKFRSATALPKLIFMPRTPTPFSWWSQRAHAISIGNSLERKNGRQRSCVEPIEVGPEIRRTIGGHPLYLMGWFSATGSDPNVLLHEARIVVEQRCLLSRGCEEGRQIR